MKTFRQYLIQEKKEDDFDGIKSAFNKRKKRNFLFGNFELEMIKNEENIIQYNVIHYGEKTNIASIISNIRRNLGHEYNDSYKNELNKKTETEPGEQKIITKMETITKTTNPGPFGDRYETNIKIERIKQ